MSIPEFVKRVWPGGAWDYKQDGSRYENFGNFNFGVTGRAVGFSQETLLRGAGAAQQIFGISKTEWGNFWDDFPSSFGDDPRDQEMVLKGIEFYDDLYGSEE